MSEKRTSEEFALSPTNIQEMTKTMIGQISSAESLISDDDVVCYYKKTIDNIQADRDLTHDVFNQFYEQLINGGDASGATKESIVALIKAKSECVDQMIEILKLWTNMKIKEKHSSPKTIAVQNNTRIETPNIRRLIEDVENSMKEERQ